MNWLSHVRACSLATLSLTFAANLAACGGGGQSNITANSSEPNKVVVRVGAATITQAAVNHWMTTLAGGDYYPLSHRRTIPPDLVSEPANYQACLHSLDTAIARGRGNQPLPPRAELVKKCRQLYTALKKQTIAYLIQAQTNIGMFRELGITTTEAEVMKLYKTVRARLFPTDTELQSYLTKRRTKLSDVLFGLKLNVLNQKAAEKLQHGGTAAKREFAAAVKRWQGKVDCSVGYVVPGCKQFHPSRDSSPELTASVLMEQIAALVTGKCGNTPACGKQVG